jgi:hypothetical protein
MNIFVIWIGDNPINEIRQNALNSIPGHTLITRDNLNEYVLKDFPLHPAFQYLSTVHKSDYLRCYLMHHYGGGYSDVKHNTVDWAAGFEHIKNNPELMVMGVKTTFGHLYAGIEEWDKTTKSNILGNSDKLFCMCWFICKPYTQFTTQWMEQVDTKLDSFLEALKVHPAKYIRECNIPHLGYSLPQPFWESSAGEHRHYPLSWNLILSQIVFPLQIKFLRNIDNTIMKTNI